MTAHQDATIPKAAPEQMGISSSSIMAFVKAAEAQVDALHSFILLRHGHKVAEGWWGPYESGVPHMLFSLSKSFTSTAVGLAVVDGLLTVDDQVISFFPEATPDDVSHNLAAMQVRHLLTMTTGHSEAALDAMMRQNETNWIHAFLTQPVDYEPGTHFVYNSGASFMLSAIVQKLMGKKIVEYLQPRIFDPLGIAPPVWETNPQGINTGGWGLNLRTEAIARFGQLYLQRGQWQGEQLIPASWVEEATAPQVDNAPNENPDWEQGYGYQFWQCRHNAYRGDGAFGQYCVVMPDQDAVFAATGGVGDMQAVLNLVWDFLLAEMQDAPLPADEGAHAELQERLATLRLPPQEGKVGSPVADEVTGRTYTFDDDEAPVDAIRFDFGDDGCVITTRDSDGRSALACGFGRWVESNIVLPGRGPRRPDDEQPVAASGAWTDDNTYVAKVYLTKTPFCRTTTCRFEGDKLTLQTEVNVSFGPTEEPELVGRAT